MILLFNGCSHTEGSKLFVEQTWANIVLKSISIDSKFLHIFSKKGRANEFLFQHLNNIENYLEEENYGISVSKSGKGNDAICFETINYVEYLISINKKPDLVFIQWSGPSRRLVQDWDDTIKFVNPHSSEEMGFKITPEPLASSLTLTYYVILQNYLENNNIPYVFLDYMGTDKNILNSYIKNNINYTNIVSHKDGYINYFKKKKLVVDNEGHPSDVGHYILASKILDKINIEPIGFFTFNELLSSSNYISKSFNTNFSIRYSKHNTLKNYKNKHPLFSISDNQIKHYDYIH